jgi:CspA family cold shock protein
MSKNKTAKRAADETLFCERCGISFLWTSEEQTSSPGMSDEAQSGRNSSAVQRPRLCPGCRHLLPDDARERGMVKWFSHKKRYGFVHRAGEPDAFVHRSEISPGVRLRPGDLVEFSVVEDERGPSAAQVSLLSRANALAGTVPDED